MALRASDDHSEAVLATTSLSPSDPGRDDIHVLLPQFWEAVHTWNVVDLKQVRSRVGKHVVIGDDVQPKPSLDGQCVRNQFRISGHERGVSAVDRLEPSWPAQLNLPRFANDHQPNGLTLNEGLEEGRFGSRPRAGEPLLVLAAVPVAPLGYAFRLGSVLAPRRGEPTLITAESTVLQSVNQTGQPVSAVHHRGWIGKARPTPERQPRKEVQVVLEDAVEDYPRNSQIAGTPWRLDEELPPFHDDLRKHLVGDTLERKPLGQGLGIWSIETDQENPLVH
jgi:hypothetical protein